MRILGVRRLSGGSRGLGVLAGYAVEVAVEPLTVEITAVDSGRLAHGVRGSGEPARATSLTFGRGENGGLFEPKAMSS